jgi:Dolichyl-phosphate-mannose-protein mannosyltransferase
MKLLASANSWRTALLIALGIFLVSRALTLMAFPIFNDEAIYLQYSQAIHDDWQRNKYIPMNGEWRDWKPPLQYWMAAPVICCGRDPLVAGRAVALFVSLLGLLGSYLFAKECFSQREAVITAILYAACPAVLFQNNQFTAETFLFSTAPFFYWTLLKTMQPKKRKLPWAVLATVMGTALLLFKQSGLLLLAVAIALPFARLRKIEASDADREGRKLARWNWKEFTANCFWLAAVIIFSLVAARLIIPSEFDGARNRFNGRWVMSVQEIFQLPMEAWRGNLRIVVEYVGSYYSWSVPLLFCTSIWFVFRRKSFPELALAFTCLAGGCAVIFLLRGFNEYLFNTAVIAVLLPLLARTGVLVWDMARIGNAGRVRAGLLLCAGIMAGHWAYQIALMHFPRAIHRAEYALGDSELPQGLVDRFRRERDRRDAGERKKTGGVVRGHPVGQSTDSARGLWQDSLPATASCPCFKRIS